MTEPDRPIVYIVDDEAPDRKHIESVFTSAGYETCTFSSGADFLKCAQELPNGCLVIDVRMPRIGGLQVLQMITSRLSNFAVIMISGASDIPIAVEAMKLGADDFVEKPCDPTELLQSAARAFARISERQEQTANLRHKQELLAKISPREEEVLQLILKGRQNKVIAFELGISERTVEKHRSRMMKRLGLGSLAELIRLAVQTGLASELQLKGKSANR